MFLYECRINELFIYEKQMCSQLNSLTTIETFIWFGGREVTQHIAVTVVSGSTRRSGKDFYICFFVLLSLRIFVFVTKT